MKGLHRKLLLTLLPVVILPLLALGLQSMLKLNEMADRNMELRLKSIAITINENLSNELRRNMVELAQLPNAEALIAYLATKATGIQKVYMGTRVQMMFHHLLVGNKGFLQLSLLNGDGNKALLQVGEGVDPFHDMAPSNQQFIQYWAENHADADQFNYLLYSPEIDEFVYKQGLRFIRSGPEISRDGGEPVQSYRLILTYSLRKFGELFLKQQEQQGIHLLLLDKLNVYIAGTAPLGWQSREQTGDEISLPDGDYLVRRLALADGLILQALIPKQLMTSEIRTLRMTTAAWLLISGLILLVMLHIVLKRQILNPVSELRDLMKRVATHEISEIEPVPIDDEMSELHNHFAGMLGRLAVSKRELERAAFIDPLTGIGNRAAFIRCLQSIVERHNQNLEHFYLTQLKLHNITWINNTFGAKTGDQALQFISHVLLQLLRNHRIANAKGVCLARSGSDEFIFTIPKLDPGASTSSELLADADTICAQLSSRLNQPVMLGNYAIKLRFSAGIISFPEIANSIEELMEGASKARRQAARYQGNYWIQLDSEMILSLREDKWLESELHKAISEQQCYVVYQPQYDLQSGQIMGAEVLIRWHHPTYGLVPPDRFIPIAERSGQILDIDLWVLEQACLFLGKLIAKGVVNFRLAVNASGTELSNPAYPEAVRSMLCRYDISPEHFGIEITETALVELDEVAQITVRALKNIGVEIELDDFGTGYTSLSHLTNLQLDVLKIDRSYTMQIESNPKLVDSILQLADAFSLRVIAEGVETIEQLQLLQQKKCHMAQGFLLSKPVNENELVKLLFDDMQSRAAD